MLDEKLNLMITYSLEKSSLPGGESRRVLEGSLRYENCRNDRQ